MWILQIFSHFSRFLYRFFTTPPSPKSNVGPIKLDTIAYVVSKVMNYDYAKCHAFMKKLTIDVIFRWL